MTTLTVLNPLFLSLLPLAALPILFHLFFRLKKRPRLFPSLMFFYRIDPRFNARRRLREWLILLLRCLLIAWLLLALAHPKWMGVGREGTVAAVLVIDNSGSMSAPGETGKPKLREAVAAAHHLVDRLRGQDAAGIVLLVEDPAVAVPAGLLSDKAALKGALDRILETEATGVVVRALEHAMALLEQSSASRFEIHVLSDLQESEWNLPPAGLRTPRQGTLVTVYRVASRPSEQANVALTEAVLPEKTVLAGRRLPLRLQFSNPTPWPANARLNWMDDAGNKSQQPLVVPARGATNALVTLAPANPGFHWASVWVEGDAFQADNRAAVGFFAAGKETVLFLGKPEDYGILPLAVSPAAEGRLSGLVPAFVAPELAAERLSTNPPALVVCTWDALSRLAGQAPARAARLRQFWEGGGNGLLTPGSGGGTLGAKPDWLEVWPARQAATNAAGQLLVVFNKRATLFDDLRTDRGDVACRNAKAFKYHPLRVPSPDNALLGLEDGQVVLAVHPLGKGLLFVSGLAFDPAWTSLVLKPAFLPLAQGMAVARTKAAQAVESLVAGEPGRGPGGPAGAWRVQSLAGSPLDWKGPRETFGGFAHSGVYAIRAGETLSYTAVRSSDKEGQTRFLPGTQLPALGGLSFAVRSLTSADTLVAEYERLQKSFDLYLPLLLLALATLVAEGWLANSPPLQRALKPRLGAVATSAAPPRAVATST